MLYREEEGGRFICPTLENRSASTHEWISDLFIGKVASNLLILLHLHESESTFLRLAFSSQFITPMLLFHN